MNAAMRKFICLACGYIYDEALGDPDGGLPAGTRYEDIPDDWMCPTCGVGKADFEPYVESASPAAAAAPIRRASRDARLPVVIVGAGTAGWAVAAALRARDTALPIVLVTACDGCLYAKPRLSVAFAQGQSAQSLISEPGPEAAARMGVRLMANTWVSGIDAPRHRLRTTRGALRYSALVLAHGATPAPLPLDAASARLTWRINHIEHYARFRAALGETSKRVAIIGAGLVGCELADDLAGAGHAVTLLDIAERPLATLADESTSTRLLGALAGAGVRFIGNARVDRIERREAALTLTGDFGSVDADLAIAATGLVTSERLARSTGLAFERGISVDAASMQSSAAGIYALGDCASFGGRAFRFIEPIHRQAAVIADHVLEKESQGFEVRTVPVRLKSRSLPLTLALAA